VQAPDRERLAHTVAAHSGEWVLAVLILLAACAPTLLGALAGVQGSGALTAFFLALLGALGFALGLWRRVRLALLVLVILLPFQPLITMPLAHEIGPVGVRGFVAGKDVYVTALVTGLLLGWGRTLRWNLVDATAIAFGGIYFLYFVLSPAELFVRAVSLREGFMIVALYAVGRLSGLDNAGLAWFVRSCVIVAVVVCAFGYVERFLFSNADWHYLGAAAYAEQKWGTTEWTQNGVPDNWSTWLGHDYVRRMVGPVGDPTSLSRFLALPVLALLFTPWLWTRRPGGLAKHVLLAALLPVALVLTLGRGGLVIVLGGVLVWAYVRRPVLTVLFGAPVMVVVLISFALFDPEGGSATRHLEGLANVASALDAPLGHGLGSSGQKAVLYAGEVDEKISESYLGGLGYQMGIVGVLAYMVFVAAVVLRFMVLIRRFGRAPGARDVWDQLLLALSLAGGIFATSLLANSAIAPISAALGLIYSGAALTWAEHLAGAARRVPLPVPALGPA
jgi:hypothetical protein